MLPSDRVNTASNPTLADICRPFQPLCPCRVEALPMDAPDHSAVDPADVAAAFEAHFGKQQGQQQAAAREEL
jgi:hypothetical protein